ncbi:MAG: L-2-hydroxyglutarate oxidase [Desulfotignum sp.]|nr:L-2-hydroxyglutarate oxidase [Desulfotignum sp.]
MKEKDFYDVTIIGGGIVGVATARALQAQFVDADILLIEKENQFAVHQTGHNSGVIHAGVYYAPGSLKADFCRRGSSATMAFCTEHGLPFRQCGKLLVATTPIEQERMQALKQRCIRNQIRIFELDQQELIHMEPRIQGLGALLVPATGICDFTAITRKMAALFSAGGGHIRTGHPVTQLMETQNQVTVHTRTDKVSTRYLVVCAGLMADRLAKMMHIDIDFSILPFRGEYYQLPAHRSSIVSRLIYPVPDPDLPFLGVHLTPMINGCITVGPNAVLGFDREGYGKINANVSDIAQMAAFPGFWKVMGRHLTSGIKEQVDSVWKPGYLARIRKYCPSLTLKDLLPYPPGIRAQAVMKNGDLVHDFLFARTPRSLHVCNAPSPAATSAIPIGQYLRDRVMDLFNL